METPDLFAKKERQHHARNLKNSDQLQRLNDFLFAGGKTGRTTWEIQQHCNTGGVSRDVDELRKNRIAVVCRYLGKNYLGRKVFCYWHPAFAPEKETVDGLDI